MPNDPRGSGSLEVREEKLADLGVVHLGRKKVQPGRQELREFTRAATPRLDFTPLWYDDAKRQTVGEAIGEVVNNVGYTVWACAVLKTHAHLCIRRHRDDAVTMWEKFAEETRNKLRVFADVDDDHPVWSTRPFKVFLYTPEDVRRVIRYIEQNPEKEGLAAQTWEFVTSYDGWPYHRPKRR